MKRKDKTTVLRYLRWERNQLIASLTRARGIRDEISHLRIGCLERELERVNERIRRVK